MNEYKPVCARCHEAVANIDETLKQNWHYDGHGVWYCETCYEKLCELDGVRL